MSFAARQLLKVARLEDAIGTILARLGEATRVSRIYVFDVRHEAGGVVKCDQRHEWVAPGITPEIDNPDLQDLDFAAMGYERWADFMARGEPIFGPIRTFPESEQDFLEAQSILSLVVVPIFVGDEWCGFIGFDDCAAERDWSLPEVEALAAAAGLLGAAKQRARDSEVIADQWERLEALREVELAIVGSLRLERTLDILLSQVTDHLEADAACVLLYDEVQEIFTFAASRGLRSSGLRKTRLRRKEGLAGRAAKARKILAVADLTEGDFARSPHFREEGFVSYFGVPLVTKGRIHGVMEVFHRSRRVPDATWMRFLESLAANAAIAIHNSALFRDLTIAHEAVESAYDATLVGWTRALDLRDRETEGHTQRVADLSVALGKKMGLSQEALVDVRRGALLHDIGKIAVPDSILLKPGSLTDDEWVIMRRHPEHAYEMLRHVPYLRGSLAIPLCHHEKWDGTGYPSGLAGEEIPFAARIFAVVDVWDALTSDRPYRRAWSRSRARAYLREQLGRHFDPVVVEPFEALLGELAVAS